MYRSRQKAILAFACFCISYLALNAAISVTMLQDFIATGIFSFWANDWGRRTAAVILVIVYFIPLALYTRKHAQIAHMKWLQKAMRFVLTIMPLWSFCGVLAIILKLLNIL